MWYCGLCCAMHVCTLASSHAVPSYYQLAGEGITAAEHTPVLYFRHMCVRIQCGRLVWGYFSMHYSTHLGSVCAYRFHAHVLVCVIRTSLVLDPCSMWVRSLLILAPAFPSCIAWHLHAAFSAPLYTLMTCTLLLHRTYIDIYKHTHPALLI